MYLYILFIYIVLQRFLRSYFEEPMAAWHVGYGAKKRKCQLRTTFVKFSWGHFLVDFKYVFHRRCLVFSRGYRMLGVTLLEQVVALYFCRGILFIPLIYIEGSTNSSHANPVPFPFTAAQTTAHGPISLTSWIAWCCIEGPIFSQGEMPCSWQRRKIWRAPSLKRFQDQVKAHKKNRKGVLFFAVPMWIARPFLGLTEAVLWSQGHPSIRLFVVECGRQDASRLCVKDASGDVGWVSVKSKDGRPFLGHFYWVFVWNCADLTLKTVRLQLWAVTKTLLIWLVFAVYRGSYYPLQ